MENLIIPKNYKTDMDLLETQILIKDIKDYFEKSLALRLDLVRVSAPMFVKKSSGLNDNLTGVEEPVSFKINEKTDKKSQVEIVHSLAKWKRFALKDYEFPVNKGLYTDMNAIRAFETLDNTHSIYVDQWDWEKVIAKEDINEDYLKKTVQEIYNSFLDLESFLMHRINGYEKLLSDEIYFISSQELEDLYPHKTPEEREKLISKEKGSVFIMSIGDKLKSGEKHGDRSPDYDDWTLNGDIIIWNPILDDCLELSSMGIRVTGEKLKEQLDKADANDRLKFNYHKLLLEDKLPFTIGGGIGQSRICMLFLQKAHIGEVQASVWPEDMKVTCRKHNIILL